MRRKGRALLATRTRSRLRFLSLFLRSVPFGRSAIFRRKQRPICLGFSQLVWNWCVAICIKRPCEPASLLTPLRNFNALPPDTLVDKVGNIFAVLLTLLTERYRSHFGTLRRLVTLSPYALLKQSGECESYDIYRITLFHAIRIRHRKKIRARG